jgi:hypothetical protein
VSKPTDTSRRERIRRLVALLAPVPDEFASYEQYVEYHHLDLASLPLAKMVFEKNRLRQFFLTFGDAMDSWHIQRLQALEARLRDAR